MTRLALPLMLIVAVAACSKPATPPVSAPSSSASDQPADITPPASTGDLYSTRIDDVLSGSWRSDANKARDAYRHPKETLAFFGVQPNQTVIEITPGGGWYTEILAPLLKGTGSYVGAIAAASASESAQRYADNFKAKIASEVDQFGEARIHEFNPKTPNLGAPDSADVVLTFRNVHNWVGNGSAEALFKAFHAVLKPGGVLGVVEHRAAPGSTLESAGDSGYLPTDFVVKLATDAGFQLLESSEINANPKDTKDYPKGVWTLPPVLALKDVDRDKYLAIGESDRMTLRFVKPTGDAIFQSDDKAADDTTSTEAEKPQG